VAGGFDTDDERGRSGDDGAAVGLDLLMRWHFFKNPRWSAYVEGGAGFIQTSSSFPSDGTHFNFTPQVGVGMLYALKQDIHLMGGLRWHHVSNAHLQGGDNNPGYDSAVVYAGLLFSF